MQYIYCNVYAMKCNILKLIIPGFTFLNVDTRIENLKLHM